MPKTASGTRAMCLAMAPRSPRKRGSLVRAALAPRMTRMLGARVLGIRDLVTRDLVALVVLGPVARVRAIQVLAIPVLVIRALVILGMATPMGIHRVMASSSASKSVITMVRRW